MNSGDSIDDWYRERQSKRSDLPDPEGWNRLQESLDLDEVWGRLSVSLNRQVARQRRRRMAIYASVALLFIGGTTSLLFIPSHSKTTAATHNSTVSSAPTLRPLDEKPGAQSDQRAGTVVTNPSASTNSGTVALQQAQPVVPANPSSKTIVAASGNPGNSVSPNAVAGTSNAGAGGTLPVAIDPSHPATAAVMASATHTNTTSALPPVNVEPTTNGAATTASTVANATTTSNVQSFSSLTALLHETAVSPAAISQPEEIKEPGIHHRHPSYYVEAFGGTRNNWLLNHDTYSAFSKSSLDYTRMTFHPSLGLSIGHAINSRFAFQSSLYLLSYSGQQYINYVEGQSVLNKIQLQYITTSFVTSFSPSGHMKSVTPEKRSEWLAGVELAGMVASKNSKVPADRLPVSYHRMDAGLVAGYQVVLPIGRNFQVIPALLYHQGVLNLRKANSVEPASFNRTFSSSAEGLVRLRYTFGD